jgi:UDP:flavonoid glycosyltransferase YjiC (YdhE family)
MAARAPRPRPLRILLVTRGSAGHVLPLAPFGRACAAAGHEVTVAAQHSHRGNVKRTGLSFAPLDGPADEDWMPLLGAFARTGVDEAHAVQISEFFARLDLRAALPGLQEIVTRLRPDLMLRDSWEFASTVVAEANGVALARVGLGLAAVEDETIRLAALPVDHARRDAGLSLDADRGTRTVFGMPARGQIDGLAEAVRTVLSDGSHRRRAQVIAGTIAALPPVDAAVAVLERIAAGAPA